MSILLLSVLLTSKTKVKKLENGELVDISITDDISRKDYIRKATLIADNILKTKQ